MNIFQKQLLFGNETMAQRHNEGWSDGYGIKYAKVELLFPIKISIEEFEKINKKQSK